MNIKTKFKTLNIYRKNMDYFCNKPINTLTPKELVSIQIMGKKEHFKYNNEINYFTTDGILVTYVYISLSGLNFDEWKVDKPLWVQECTNMNSYKIKARRINNNALYFAKNGKIRLFLEEYNKTQSSSWSLYDFLHIQDNYKNMPSDQLLAKTITSLKNCK